MLALTDFAGDQLIVGKSNRENEVVRFRVAKHSDIGSLVYVHIDIEATVKLRDALTGIINQRMPRHIPTPTKVEGVID